MVTKKGPQKNLILNITSFHKNYGLFMFLMLSLFKQFSSVFIRIVKYVWMVVDRNTKKISWIYSSKCFHMKGKYRCDNFNRPIFFFSTGENWWLDYPLMELVVEVFNSIFKNMSAISWRSALLVEETRKVWENHDELFIYKYVIYSGGMVFSSMVKKKKKELTKKEKKTVIPLLKYVLDCLPKLPFKST